MRCPTGQGRDGWSPKGRGWSFSTWSHGWERPGAGKGFSSTHQKAPLSPTVPGKATHESYDQRTAWVGGDAAASCRLPAQAAWAHTHSFTQHTLGSQRTPYCTPPLDTHSLRAWLPMLHMNRGIRLSPGPPGLKQVLRGTQPGSDPVPLVQDPAPECGVCARPCMPCKVMAGMTLVTCLGPTARNIGLLYPVGPRSFLWNPEPQMYKGPVTMSLSAVAEATGKGRQRWSCHLSRRHSPAPGLMAGSHAAVTPTPNPFPFIGAL